jgi:hypothetical protein
MSNPPPVKDSWSAGKLVLLTMVTLAIAFTVINLIAETGLNRP